MDLAKRTKVEEIEKSIGQIAGAVFGDTELCPLTHSFAPEMYVREIQIPAGTLLVGKIHKNAHPNFLMAGKVSVFTEDGGTEHLTAPCYMISPAGTKRVVYTHEDTAWVTVHHNPENTTDLERLEDHVIAKDFSDRELTENQMAALEGLCLG